MIIQLYIHQKGIKYTQTHQVEVAILIYNQNLVVKELKFTYLLKAYNKQDN